MSLEYEPALEPRCTLEQFPHLLASPLPSEKGTTCFSGCLPESQDQILILNVIYVPHSLDSGMGVSRN